MVAVTIYVEGGGNNRAVRADCRKGFHVFLENAGFRGRMPKVVACGGRNEAYDRFCTASRSSEVAEFALLLVDSEGPVVASAWDHLKARDRWKRPARATDDQAQLMVQCMEAWFLADKERLAAFYGQGFIAERLPRNANVEQVAKADVMRGLKMATRATKKGEYFKGSHSFEILEGIDPGKVRALPHAARFLAVLEAKLT